MGLITKEVEVDVSNRNKEYYKNLGYNIPEYYNVNNKLSVKKGTKIKIKTEHLPKGSHYRVNVGCDCDECNNIVNVQYKSYLHHLHDGKYYCHKCANKILRSGINHPRWNSSLTSEDREKGRNTPENTEFIKKCMVRANYCSELSGKRIEKAMEVHHLNDWANHIEQRYDTSNGIVLTEDEHKAFHNWQRINYPKQPCTKEQFEEWCGHIIDIINCDNLELETARKIFCIEDNYVYDGVTQLRKILHCSDVSIYRACDRNNRLITSVKGKHLLWYDEYLTMTEQDVFDYLEWCKYRKSQKNICLNTLEVFESYRDAGRFYGVNSGSIGQCCMHKLKSAGKTEDGTKLVWMRYEDFLKLPIEEQEKILARNKDSSNDGSFIM